MFEVLSGLRTEDLDWIARGANFGVYLKDIIFASHFLPTGLSSMILLQCNGSILKLPAHAIKKELLLTECRQGH